MKLNKYIILLVLFLSFQRVGFGQESVQLIGRAHADSIVLRWAPTSPTAWQLLNKFGYQVERYTILRNGKMLDQPEHVKLSTQALVPQPLAQWEALAEKDKYVAIAAQAIYGQSFELTESYSSDMVQVFNAAKEQEQRFSFALLSADLSAQVARYAALGLVDKNIRPNEKYLYRVYSAAPAEVLQADTGFVYLGVEDTLALPKPVRVGAEFGNGMALLKWNKSYYENIYIAYQVERSADGKNFSPISELPITNTEAPHGYKPEWMFKLDSLPQNGTTYYYRVKGLTPFGELGPPSDIISGKGFVPLKANPAVTAAEVANHTGIKLNWQFDKETEKLLKGFAILRASKANGMYETLEPLVPAAQRQFTDTRAQTVNYYKVVALSKAGEEVESFPYLAQLEDSIPPSAPTQLVGQIDSTGSVQLQWAASPEADVLGYRIYRSNFDSNEFTQLTRDPVEATRFTDKINVKTLTKNIYYKLVAVDNRQNPSSFSEVLALDRPDVLPPVSPAFSAARSTKQGIALRWNRSSSEDVAQHLLYRREGGSSNWQLIAYFADTTSQYVDKALGPGRFYEYTLLAKDKQGLESEPALPVRAKKLKDIIKPAIKNIVSRLDAEEEKVVLQWSYKEEGVKEYVLYRARGEEGLSLYQTFEGLINQFADFEIKPGNTYRYQIKAVFGDGSESALSKEITIRY
jgi:fibronectin type 3 domain-containing protein